MQQIMSLLIEQKKWIFLDIGSTLVNEDQYLRERDTVLYQLITDYGVEITLQDYQQVVNTIKHDLPKSVAYAILARFISDSLLREQIYQCYKDRLRPHQKKYRQLYPDVFDVLPTLANHIQLGIIADQEAWVGEALANLWHISSFFDVIVLSKIVGFSKPDSRLFALALSRANVQPDDAIMLGDRPDKDIAPANQIGMTSVRIRRGMDFKNSPPRHPAEVADYEISELVEISQL